MEYKLKEEENELVTNCHQLKMRVAAEWIKKKSIKLNGLICYFIPVIFYIWRFRTLVLGR